MPATASRGRRGSPCPASERCAARRPQCAAHPTHSRTRSFPNSSPGPALKGPPAQESPRRWRLRVPGLTATRQRQRPVTTPTSCLTSLHLLIRSGRRGSGSSNGAVSRGIASPADTPRRHRRLAHRPSRRRSTATHPMTATGGTTAAWGPGTVATARTAIPPGGTGMEATAAREATAKGHTTPTVTPMVCTLATAPARPTATPGAAS